MMGRVRMVPPAVGSSCVLWTQLLLIQQEPVSREPLEGTKSICHCGGSWATYFKILNRPQVRLFLRLKEVLLSLTFQSSPESPVNRRAFPGYSERNGSLGICVSV